jgi:nitrite reductase (NADH) small subunit
VTEATWTDIGALDQIPRRGARVVRTAQGCVAVFRTVDDHAFALDDRCPHRGGPLSQGIVHGTSVTCPLHNWVVSLETGEAQGADEGSARAFPLRVESGRVLIDLAALAGSPALEDAAR